MRAVFLFCALSPIHTIVCANEATQVYISEGELNYVGNLDEKANQRLFTLYDGLKDKPTVLAVRSRGGDVVPGMDLGDWVHAHKLNVKVMEFCLSSCANYVFTAGAQKIVGSNAMIAVHGGLSSTEFSIGGSKKNKYEGMKKDQKTEFQAELRKGFQPLLDRETLFFKSIGVRQDITTYGQQARFANISADGWTFTQDSFRYFGVGNVEVINPHWGPRLLTLHANIVTLTAE